ncbi:hypothetical protein [Brasilonema sp. UFV-L1]|uniref:hypothetical protein n=1 Tax=Brasilonema sp. UFV-L1 TaxID=2234130 RepID=UPI00145E23A0|nr:hypothetical protein [Brasilonema sp. UFV-L1]NMG10464.1 hypothetical protein [Brasilonema sp. UFV-L1]
MEKDIELIRKNLGYYTGLTFWDTAILPKMKEESDNARRIMERVKRLFQVANKCQEIVVRHRNALIGNTPTWYIVNQQGEREESGTASAIAEHLRRLQAQWLRMSIGRYPLHSDPIAKAVDDALTTGYGYLRLWSPARFAKSANIYQRIGLHSPDIESVNIIRDNDEFVDKIEYTFIYKNEALKEVQQLDEQGRTVFHWENANGDRVTMDNGLDEIKLDLGGHFTVYEIKRSPLITDTVRRAQDAINHALTMMPTNIEYSGFLTRVVANGLPPGTWEVINGRETFTPTGELLFSPGVTNFVAGIPTFDNAGNILNYTTPSVSTEGIADVAPLINAYKTHCAVIYETTHQAHILSSDMTISGISRQQLRADFKTSLGTDKVALEAILADCWATALFMLLQGQIATIKKYDIIVDLLLELGEPSAEERAAVREDYKAGLLSQQTAISLNGYVDNPAAEVENIKQESQQLTTINEDVTNDVVDLPRPTVIDAAA